ncbi:hypothetical protein H5410_033086 [Solanum commersonii]|uniref:TIR domain-containing protein n=1 Tax=Solanum commersonii TaxID=4109 RepID=A0A9J5YRJ4_SOLCO|nr:hypothetical protein H5410_033086 [Solanum commersonii]
MASQIQSAQKWKFDVFFNFRQHDLDKSFVAHLQKRLKDIGINTFKPDVKSECGEQISTEILEAIDESRIALTIFSKCRGGRTLSVKQMTWKDQDFVFAGAEFFHWFNGKCIAEIVNKICQVPRIAKYPVGIKSRVEEVKSLLKVESGGVYFIGLWGRCGVGKTTVAREIFDEISCQAKT